MKINREFWELPEWWREAEPDDPRWREWHEARAEALGGYYDEDLADDHVAFFKTLRHFTGRWAGKKFVPMPWQEHLVIRTLFGYLKPSGLRMFRKVFVAVPKKNGKSEFVAGLALDLLWWDAEPGAVVLGAARDIYQASLVYDVAAGMTEITPELTKRLDLVKSKKRIVHEPSRSYYMAVSSDKGGKHGYNIHGLVIDEEHAIEDQEFIEILTTGSMDAREQPVEAKVTTAGHDRESMCFKDWVYARKVRDGKIEDRTLIPVIFELDEEDDWEDEANWFKCNPALGITVDLEKVREAYQLAKERPDLQNKFRQMRCNQWTSQETRWLPMDKWDACGPVDEKGRAIHDLRQLMESRKALMEEVKGEQAIGWLDLSSSVDLTTFGLLYPSAEEGGKFRILPWFFLPSENLEDKGRLDRASYEEWANAGFLELTEGNAVDYNRVRARMTELRTEGFKFKEVPADDWNLGNLAQDLELDGFEVIDWPQTVKHMSPGSKLLLELTLTGRIEHAGNPILRYCADNLTVKMDNNERVLPVKGKSKGRIDGVVGAIMALGRWIQQRPPEASVYESEDIAIFDM